MNAKATTRISVVVRVCIQRYDAPLATSIAEARLLILDGQPQRASRMLNSLSRVHEKEDARDLANEWTEVSRRVGGVECLVSVEAHGPMERGLMRRTFMRWSAQSNGSLGFR